MRNDPRARTEQRQDVAQPVGAVNHHDPAAFAHRLQQKRRPRLKPAVGQPSALFRRMRAAEAGGIVEERRVGEDGVERFQP